MTPSERTRRLRAEMSVRVYCPICKKGNNVIWQGSLLEWRQELEKEDPPAWAHYAHRHEKAHSHQVMVRYPDGLTVPFKLGKEAEGRGV